jgi:selenocysteine-specific elongation factor
VPIVGTAGHVDHGKSTLVEALTGRDPDRWAEEKRRGLTIDLGFAWAELAPGLEAGFVDVPGHERFVRNMLAGVGALDAGLFVVAADEGWMPQSEEHLSVLDLLDVRHGVVALTRVDLVDDDTRELMLLEVQDKTAGTTLETWPVVPVAAPVGEGVAEIRAALAGALAAAGPPADVGRPRLWVDRSFLVAGAGAVVTGTLVGGRLERDDRAAMWPEGSAVRIRGIQTHEHDVEVALPGTRTAVNLAGTERRRLGRGTMLGRAGAHVPTRQVLVDLRTVRGLGEPVAAKGAYHLHAGTGVWPVRMRPVEGHVIDGAGAALLTLPSPVVLEMGDRVILREVGRRAVVAGGRVVDPAPGRRLRDVTAALARLRRAVDAGPDARAAALLATRGLDAAATLAAHSGGGRAVGLNAGGVVASEAEAGNLVGKLSDLVSAWQASNPLRPGAPKAEMASRLGVDAALVDVLVAASSSLVDDASTIRTADFRPGWDDRNEERWEAARDVLAGAGLAVPRASQLGLDTETLHAAVRAGKVIRVAEDLLYLPEQIDEITRRLADLADGFTVADFRDALGLSRRQAVPLLEWADAQGWTSRRGDTRVVRRRNGPGSSAAPTP